MTATLKRISAPILATRTLVMTATTGVQTIVIGGIVSNTDSTQSYHGVTVEIQDLNSNYINLVTLAPIAYGGSLILPKFVIGPGEKLYMTADVANFVQANVSYVEKS